MATKIDPWSSPLVGPNIPVYLAYKPTYRRLKKLPEGPSLGAKWSLTWGKMATCSLYIQVSCYNINRQHHVQTRRTLSSVIFKISSQNIRSAWINRLSLCNTSCHGASRRGSLLVFQTVSLRAHNRPTATLPSDPVQAA